MAERISDAELSGRAAVWAALSNLFVDTDVRLLHRYIAQELSKSSYSETELLAILRDEVGPTFSGNLLSIAGEWEGWNEDEARAEVSAYLALPTWLRIARRLASRPIVEWVIRNHWSDVRSLWTNNVVSK